MHELELICPHPLPVSQPRRSAGVPQSSARMAALVMELVAPDLSFVLHTARPRDGNTGVLLAEVAPGQGETLASGELDRTCGLSVLRTRA